MLTRTSRLCVFLLPTCRRPPDSKVVRLVDVSDGANIEGSPSKKVTEPGTLWDFSKPPKPKPSAGTANAGGPPPYETESYGIVHEGWKMVHHVHRPAGTEEFELFNHAEDPLDSKNVAGQNPDQAARLQALLTGWNQMVESGKLPKGESAEGLSSKELERLKSLGYVQ